MSNRPADKALERGLKRHLVDVNGVIVGPAWYRAWESKDIIGTCRVYGCDGLMVALPNHRDGNHTWYGADCLSCGHEVAIRDDKPVLDRSTRRHEMPSGTFDRRERYLKAIWDAKQKGSQAG